MTLEQWLARVRRRLARRPGFGFRPDAPDRRDRSVDVLGLSPADDVRADLWRPIAIADQKDTESCTGHAAATAFRLASMAQLDVDPGQMSALHNYWLSRHNLGWQKRDDGSTMREAAKALMKWGICGESAWPFRRKKINRQPPIRAIRAGFDHRGLRGYYRIIGEGASRRARVRAALSVGLPVFGGWPVDHAFMDASGPQFVRRCDPTAIAGWHALVITGFDARSGPTTYDLVNSWGAAWRSDGRVRVSGDFIDDGADLWAFDLRS